MRWQLQADEGVKGSLFSAKDVRTCAQVCADGNECMCADGNSNEAPPLRQATSIYKNTGESEAII